MTNNMPILYRNIMDGLPNDFARDVFLWATDQFFNDRLCYNAEYFAREVIALSQTTESLIALRQRVALRDGGLLLDERQESDLANFIMRRHANYRLGGNKRPPYAEAVA